MSRYKNDARLVDYYFSFCFYNSAILEWYGKWCNSCDIGQDKDILLRKFLIIFLLINLNICFGCSKEPFH